MVKKVLARLMIVLVVASFKGMANASANGLASIPATVSAAAPAGVSASGSASGSDGTQEWEVPFTPFQKIEKYLGNPILKPAPSETGFMSSGAFNPAVIFEDGLFQMLYRAQNAEGVSTIGLAISKDGMNFTPSPKPVITPDQNYELPGGCEDPRIIKVLDTFYLTYTGFSHKGTPSCLATSKDLVHWEKFGPITPAKSAAILNVQVNGQYWLYFGDTNIWAAHSPDLIHWTRVEKPVLTPREGSWDDDLVESGPPPILTKQGILLIYNGNLTEARARELGKKKGRDQVREYSTGWALFDKNDPTKLIARSVSPILTVTEPHEVYGQVNDVVFTEGMVIKDGEVYLYYGGADTTVNLAKAHLNW